jgi:hypothetical protein
MSQVDQLIKLILWPKQNKKIKELCSSQFFGGGIADLVG